MQHDPNGLRECPHCGKQVRRTTHICPHCRESLAELDQDSRERTSPLPYSDKAAPPQPSRRLTQIVFSPFSVFVLIAVAFAFSLFFYKGTENELREDAPESEPAPAVEPIPIERRAPRRRYEITDITTPTTPTVGTDEEAYAARKRSHQAAARKQKIKSIANDIFRKLKQEEVATTDTLYLKSGRVLHCTIIEDLGLQWKVRYKGVTTTIEKADIDQIKHLSQQAVDMKMRRMSLEQAIRIVDTGLVRHGDTWITPEEKDAKEQL